MLSPIQLQYLSDIEALVQSIRAADVPPVIDPPVVTVPPGASLNQVLAAAVEGAIVDLNAQTFTVSAGTSLVIPKPLTLRNGTIQALNGVNDLVMVEGDGVTVRDLLVRGAGDTKRGIQINGRGFTAERLEVRNIRRIGQESQAVATWNSPGDIIIRDSVLEGGSQSFLAGGAQPRVANTVPTNLLFENVLFTRPLDWRGQGYVCKTGFELKTGRNVTVRNCTIEHVWVEGQTGFAITLTPVNYSNSPDTQIADVLFEGNTIRHVGGGLNCLGFTQEASPTLQSERITFRDNTITLSRALYGGHGALMQLARGPRAITWDGNHIVADGDAFVRTSDTTPIEAFAFTGNAVNVPGTYGVFTPVGSRGTNFLTVCPGGVIEGNTFTAAHSIFRTNFPNNVWL